MVEGGTNGVGSVRLQTGTTSPGADDDARRRFTLEREERKERDSLRLAMPPRRRLSNGIAEKL